jgi:hypothetical protein
VIGLAALAGWFTPRLGSQALLVIAGPIVLLLLALAIAQPHLILWGMLGATFFGNRTELPGLELLGRWLPTACILLFAPAAIITLRRLSRVERAIVSPTVLLMLALGAVITLSAFANGSELTAWAIGFGVYLRYPLFFLMLLLLGFRAAAYRRWLDALLVLTVLQVPITLVQYLVFGLWGDLLQGTMGANGPLLMAMLAGIVLLHARQLAYGFEAWLTLLTASLLVPLVLADIQVGIVLVPIVVGFMTLRAAPAIRLRRAITVGVLVLATGAVATAFVYLVVPETLRVLSDVQTIPDTFASEYIATASVGRLTLVPFMLNLLSEHVGWLTWGFGPEATYGGLLGGPPGPACELVIERGLRVCITTQLFRTTTEFGLLGLALSLLLVGLIWRANQPLLRPGVPPEARLLGLSFEAMVLLYGVLLPIYTDAWRVDVFPFFFWLWAGAVVATRRALEGREAPP